jgi:hypothetical protein
MCDSRNEINNAIIKLWEKNHENLDLSYKEKNNKKRKTAELFWPNLHLPAPAEIDLLVVGLNPSHKFPKHKSKVNNKIGTAKTENKIFQQIIGKAYTEMDIVDALKYSNAGYGVDEILEFEKIGQESHNYFQKFWELGKSIFGTAEKTYHIDLYQFRESNSELIKQFISKNDKFFLEQADLTFEYIKELKPKIIFVANKPASDEFVKNYDPEFDEKWGCYKVTIDGNETPLILSGMITQSRSIDDYSFERLIWHMKFINTALDNVQVP